MERSSVGKNISSSTCNIQYPQGQGLTSSQCMAPIRGGNSILYHTGLPGKHFSNEIAMHPQAMAYVGETVFPTNQYGGKQIFNQSYYLPATTTLSDNSRRHGEVSLESSQAQVLPSSMSPRPPQPSSPPRPLASTFTSPSPSPSPTFGTNPAMSASRTQYSSTVVSEERECCGEECAECQKQQQQQQQQHYF